MKKRREHDPIGSIIQIVDKIYGDGEVGLYYRQPRKNHGDSLAAFIVREIRSVCSGADYEEALREASRALERASDQLQDVSGALYHAAANIADHKKNTEWKELWDALSEILEKPETTIPKDLRKRAIAAVNAMKRRYPEEA